MLKFRKFVWPGLLIFLSVMRFCANGLIYYPQLDDYIQYYKYTSLNSPAEAVIKYGMLAARPLSNAADVFVWANFWGNLFFAVIILAVLYAFSAILFYKIFKIIFGIENKAAALIYLLLPLNIEGTYWLSASTRVVCGLFFVSLAALLLIKWLEKNKILYLILFAVLQLCAMAAYEQTLMLTAALSFIIIIKYKQNKKIIFAGLIIIINLLIYFIFTGYFKQSSALYSGVDIISPFSLNFWTDQLPHVLKQIIAAFAGGGFLVLFNGFIRGVKLIFSGEMAVFAILALFCAVLTGFYFYKNKNLNKKANYNIIFLAGLFLILAPIAPHVLKSNPWFSLRGTVCSFPGIMLCLQVIFNKFKLKNFISGFACGLFIFIAFIATGSELLDYKQTYITDQKVMSAIADAIDLENFHGRVALVGLEPDYLENQNFYFHEHIHGVTESDWALSGALYAYSNGKLDPAARFVPVNNPESDYLNFDLIFIYKNGIFIEINQGDIK